MDAETSDPGGTFRSEEVPGPEIWLIDIIDEELARLTEKTGNQADKQPTRPITPIQKAEEKLRKSNETCFDPKVVSLGPFHHGKQGLEDMESYKKVSAVWFILLATGKRANEVTGNIESINIVYQEFKKALKAFSPSARYAGHEFFHEPKFRFESEDLMPMMFLDGCFILHFIHGVVNGWSHDDLSNSSHHLIQKQIVRDMFLLENQIPFPILSALMSLLPDPEKPLIWIMRFIVAVFLPPSAFNFSAICHWRVLFDLFTSPPWTRCLFSFFVSRYHEDNEPLHLLDLLRAVLVGPVASPDSSHGSGPSGYWDYYLRPIAELKAKGIQVSRGNSWMLKEVKFKRRPINSNLVLPQIVVDDSTETRLLNLLAYEKCDDGPLDRTVTSYVCFLDSLIHDSDDVKELQGENILLNRLGSNEEVDILFKKLAANLSPDYNVYNHVINDIKEHDWRHFNPERARIGEWKSQFIRTYFTNPWTIISLIAAIFLLFLTLLQTIYSMLGFYKT